jgi:PAS domain S-box-containing protein
MPGGLGDVKLSASVRAVLLDPSAWGEILQTFGHAMRVAAALTDAEGQLLGDIHNAQPVWGMLRDAAPAVTECGPLWVAMPPPCTAVQDALRTGLVVTVHDRAGLAHSVVPLLLGTEPLGAVVAGQVFDRYPDPLVLRRVAREFGVSAHDLWAVARSQQPVSAVLLESSSRLLGVLGRAFLRQRYAAILEATLAETNGRFRLLVEAVSDYALFTMDPAGHVTSWNSGAERMLGYDEAQILGQDFSRIFTPGDTQNRVPERHLNKAVNLGLSEEEGWRVTATQKRFWARVNITPIVTDAGSAGGFAVIVQDVTEGRKGAIVLEEARQERARLHDHFLSHVSHELRTPLTAIYFFTTNVLDGILGDVNAEQREQLTLALENVDQLKHIVTDLLDITLVDTHRIVVEPEDVSTAKLIAEVISTCGTTAAAKSIALKSDVAPGLPFVWADPTRVRQILTNLIVNGIKFTPEHGTVTVGSRPYAEDQRYLCLWVSDTGSGISPENREVIFDRLAQVTVSERTSRGGLGLGLFISSELVARHGGRIWVESELGHGSTFYFTLPVAPAHVAVTAPILKEQHQ